MVICPTDTVYGFLADATNKKAVEKIYEIKKRPKTKPLPVFVRDLKMTRDFTEIDNAQAKILRKFWPGKYTFVLKRRLCDARRHTIYGVDKNTIAVRIPKYKFLNDLLKKINRPLAQTSVNISDQKSLNKIGDILTIFGKNQLVGLIIDAGDLKNTKPSKIIDLTKEELTISRK